MCMCLCLSLGNSCNYGGVFFNFLFLAGKRIVKPSKMTKEMDADRVCPISASHFPKNFPLPYFFPSAFLSYVRFVVV
jgi:hypothetical protein